MMRAFSTYVRSILECASPVWSPRTKVDISRTKSVQRHFIKIFPGLWKFACQIRLAVLGIESLQLRPLQLVLVYTYKILFGMVDVDAATFSKMSVDSVTRGHQYKLFLTESRVKETN
jgi:hypothetical protein